MRGWRTPTTLLVVALLLTAGLAALQTATRFEMAFGGTFCIIACFGVYATLARVVAGKRYHGRHYDARSWQLARAFRSTKLWKDLQSRLMNVVIGSCILFAAALAKRAPVVVLVPVAFFALQWLAFMVSLRSVPPTLLMLGTSSPAFGRAVHDFRQALSPARVIALLAVAPGSGVEYAHGWLRQLPWSAADRLDDFRIEDGSEWKPLVATLCQQARAILIDARIATDALIDEAAIIASQTNVPSLVAVTQDGKCPLLDRLPAAERDFFNKHAVFSEPDLAFEMTERALRIARGSTTSATRP